ncbi:hypothetical protein HVS_15835 [Acetivibrio saccincola]|jgi:hypothetical protein|uniref:Uncharacterized protein n=1 Tax=Acetivibrio saccincola TaxID=1677857 RepID=A0A2K9E5M6_9FIRM|nr:hypothetical protein HVS_15835 [Acetivibrio saccincola]
MDEIYLKSLENYLQGFLFTPTINSQSNNNASIKYKFVI